VKDTLIGIPGANNVREHRTEVPNCKYSWTAMKWHLGWAPWWWVPLRNAFAGNDDALLYETGTGTPCASAWTTSIGAKHAMWNNCSSSTADFLYGSGRPRGAAMPALVERMDARTL
jgi:hypothetical protein